MLPHNSVHQSGSYADEHIQFAACDPSRLRVPGAFLRQAYPAVICFPGLPNTKSLVSVARTTMFAPVLFNGDGIQVGAPIEEPGCRKLKDNTIRECLFAP